MRNTKKYNKNPNTWVFLLYLLLLLADNLLNLYLIALVSLLFGLTINVAINKVKLIGKNITFG